MRHDYVEDDVFTPDMTFGQVLKKKRRLLGYNQTDFAEKLDVHQGTISMWELGVTSPPIDEATYILKRLGFEVQILKAEDVGGGR